MIFEKDNIIFQILDIFYYKESGQQAFHPKSTFDSLSLKIKSVAVCETKNEKISIPEHSVCYTPCSAVLNTNTKTNESISIHLKIHNYSSDKVELFIPADYPKYEKLFKNLLECWTKKSGPYKYEAAAILNNIFSEFNIDLKTESGIASKIAASVQYIEDNIFKEDLSLTVAAKKSAISDVYFRKLFAEEFKISPKKYVINKRMEYASSLIMMGYHSLQEISEMCGYKDYKHFSVEFKKHFGLSPSQYYYPPNKKKK